MLLTPANEFGWSVDNFGATYTDAGFGTSVNAHASTAHTKGTAVSLIAGASVTEDVYGIHITFGGTLAIGVGADRKFLADLLIDPAGGTSWSTLINNLFVYKPDFSKGGTGYYFPIYLKAGTSIGLRQQCNTANTTMRCAVRLFGKPSRPDLVKVGTKIETFGATTASTTGTAVTPGTQSLGSYSSLGTTSGDLWWWQCAGFGWTDTTIQIDNAHYVDVACGNASNKRLCIHHMRQYASDLEFTAKDSFGMCPPIQHIKGGETVYVRAANFGGSNTSPTTIVYGLGG